MGSKIVLPLLYVLIMFFACNNDVLCLENGYYKSDNIYTCRYCYVRNDTIWFNYNMPIGEGYIRFAKGKIHKNGMLEILRFNDKLETSYDTVFIKKDDSINQLLISIYDFRTNRKVQKPIIYMIHEDYSYKYDKRIFLKEPINLLYGTNVLDYSSLTISKAVLSFDSFKNDYDLSDKIQTVYLEIRKGEQAKYNITLAPRITYSEHFSELQYDYKEDQKIITLFFNQKIDGFSNHSVEYHSVEHPDMDDILKFVFEYYIY